MRAEPVHRGEEADVRRSFILEYWTDDGWYVGRLRDVPGVFSQGKTLADLEDNIRDAFRLMTEEDRDDSPEGAQLKEVELEV